MHRITLRSTGGKRARWFELTLGVFSPPVDELLGRLDGGDAFQGLALLGADLAHLVRGPHESGWDIPPGEEHRVVEEVLTHFDRAGSALFDRLGSRSGLLAFARRRSSGDLSDPVVSNDQVVVPLILYTFGDADAARAYAEQALLEVRASGIQMRERLLSSLVPQITGG